MSVYYDLGFSPSLQCNARYQSCTLCTQCVYMQCSSPYHGHENRVCLETGNHQFPRVTEQIKSKINIGMYSETYEKYRERKKKNTNFGKNVYFLCSAERRTHSIPSENRSLDNVSAAPCYRLTVARSRNTKNNTENRKVFQFDVHRVPQRTPGKYRPAFVHTLYCVVCQRWRV